ncbi:serine/threonine protein kinase [Cylindrospermopsis raciborskii S07]|uniref:Serine/threonine protein kinase n=1 Tax=Cylindrospermopsis raciborskii CS-505 TaxID=533240 RepID=A0A853MCZ7_9CYAN|nr:bifunctional serine/threonine-protein kinase/formylglycine-generating enzyme family protein [Cylindrospermopsis raciborskii]EFA70884.1 Serine/Threonine protein kinase [Cylindrospermopsis raciborskii CS-505]OBU75058.1 serine/threonine protein kinase [Cylindrospermopsis raciborskii CS-505]PNK04764.1 serine/threonine protein kinase [Cylindrospermopsis raciborskii S07]PNK06869.1 serine/threonine protein kinase [Cylindrospermopsis raciborskii S10]PNK11022.1 serine/threonine protein kinase [Cylin
MQICQNPNCSNPFNLNHSRFCIVCGHDKFGEILRNRYRVLRLLGEGGFSKTYAAEDVDRLDAPCVIKQFFPQVQGTVERAKAAEFFKEEAYRLYELGENHSQIPRLLAYFEQGSSLYLVQEFIIGKTLLEELKERPYTEAQIRQLLLDLLPVLDFIHHKNVIHRDIKPENIIRRSLDNKLVLIDFGGAKQVTKTTMARQATAIYTLGYAPTEQMAGFACHASDLYALGVTCIRLLTQCLPVQNSYQLKDPLYDPMRAKWLWQEFLQGRGVIVSQQLIYILNRLLQHFAQDRYQSAMEVLYDLQNDFSHTLTSDFNYINSDESKINLGTPIIEVATAQQKLAVNVPPLEIFEFQTMISHQENDKVKHERRIGKFFTEELNKHLYLEMILVPGGSFLMGSPEFQGNGDEHPQHQVIVEPFYMAKYPITQAQWKAVATLPKVTQNLNPNPSRFKGVNLPVENVSWYEAVEFCLRLSLTTGRNYRLPSEAEWEYACRAGTTTAFYFGETITPDLINCNVSQSYIADFGRNFTPQITEVGNLNLANAFGLYDMHGLVWEWCADPWHNNYHGAPRDGSVWDTNGDINRRVLRGGAWNFSAELCRSASRSWNEAEGGLRMSGFRVVLSFYG